MTSPRYTPPCRLLVKRAAIVQGHELPVGEYRVWWGRNWMLEFISDDPIEEAFHSRVLLRQEEDAPR